jgi:hypothetical protein
VTTHSPARLPIRVDPGFAEAVVWRFLSSSEIAGTELPALHADRVEPLYSLAAGPEREVAFERVALAEFEDLGFGDAIRGAIEERVEVASRVRAVLLAEAGSRLEEGVTWEPSGRHLGIRLELTRFDDHEGLVRWVRHVLGHAQDTLDRTFAFEPGWAETSLGAPAQGRFHRLWDVTVDARLAAAGRSHPGASREAHRSRLAAALPGAAASVVDALLDRLWDGQRPTFTELVAWSANRHAFAEGSAGSRDGDRPDRCPLCRFPGDDVVTPSADIAKLVMAEYPAWRPLDGLCGRCTDRYRFARRLGGAE